VASLAFEILSLEYPNLHLPIVKQFCKQKLFVIAMKFLEEKMEKFSENHLTATAHIFKITPHAVLKMNIEKVGPIMFKCIETDTDGSNNQPKATYIVLKIINHFVKEKHQYVVDHLGYLVKQLLALTKYKGKLVSTYFDTFSINSGTFLINSNKKILRKFEYVHWNV
jgi:DNA repair/transcription protein MET18/MMS19